ncbi:MULTISPECIES: hypothetical protein [unclassified Brenneria]|uniref:hypothetical protein n=1 Tax=unclassified Brenneria TaxID=2634434 RepID=UPI0018F0E651|nr:hypothetical protein [Brenneria sp. L3-3C-1]MBJ7223604.1 hypothetical protein [Brenneria sp. L3-3C-1]MEE3644846.1 hypothetical protein [Brenneria sp. L3_3C_1]
METTIKQDRIALKNLKAADFASEETLCFTATVLFDGIAIAEARNDGQGGMTFVHAHKGKAVKLAEAEQFARSLPPDTLECGTSGEDDEPIVINVTLDYLVDQLAEAMHADRKLRTAYARSINNKVLFVKNGKLLFLKGTKLKAIADQPAFFAALRTRQKEPIVILAELPPDEAFALWKQHVLGDEYS